MYEHSEIVILLHGILRTDSSMNRMERYLKNKGYTVFNVHYPSSEKSIEDLAEDFLAEKLKNLPSSAKIHFVTHSMGGLLARAYLSKHKPENMGRVVMLSPPNQGSEVADFLKEKPVLNWIFDTVYGPAGQQLGTDSASFAETNNAEIDFELGIIAGNKSVNPAGYILINKPSDGTVSVESTKIQGMSDHVTLPVNHTFIMYRTKVIEQVINFLEFGKFK